VIKKVRVKRGEGGERGRGEGGKRGREAKREKDVKEGGQRVEENIPFASLIYVTSTPIVEFLETFPLAGNRPSKYPSCVSQKWSFVCINESVC
jgi:hypothetical protein